MGAPIKRKALHHSLLSFMCGNVKRVAMDHHHVGQPTLFFFLSFFVLKKLSNDPQRMYDLCTGPH